MKRPVVCVIAVSMLTCGTSVAFAGQAQTSGQETNSNAKAGSSKQQATKLQEVVVTGTRALNRTATDSLAPIDIISSQELQHTGATNLAEALRTLLPALNFPQPSGVGVMEGALPVQLRGLSPNETLVLINGKRVHPTAQLNFASGGAIGRGSSPVDLGAIPLNAVGRIEVLRDGASALYGSDAIAGVINVILKKRQTRPTISISGGIHDKVNGANGRTWIGDAGTGFKLGNQGWMNVFFNYFNQNLTSHSGPDLRSPGDPRYGQSGLAGWGLPKQIAWRGATNMQYKLGDHATLYGYAIYAKRRTTVGTLYRLVSNYAAEHPAAAIVYPDGFLPHLVQNQFDLNSVFGVRGTIDSWHYDISGDYGTNHAKSHEMQSFNYSLGANSPTSAYRGTSILKQSVFNADFQHGIEIGSQLWYLSTGLEYRHQKFQLKAGELASYVGSGIQGDIGRRPADASSHTRSNVAEYVDITGNITNKLSTEAAVRHEHYTDFGNNNSWSLSGRYDFNPVVAMRATVGTGFRAPSLQQEFFSVTNTTLVANVTGATLSTIHTFPVSDPVAIALGAQPLKPEKSNQYTLGIVLSPANGMNITLDAYDIKLKNRILLSGQLVGPNVVTFLEGQGFFGVQGGQFFTNAANTRTLGAGLVVAWPLQFTSSHLELNFAANYNNTDITSVRPNPPQLGLAGLTLPVLDRQAAGFLTVAVPRTKASLGATWSFDGWTLRGQAVYYGSVTWPEDNPAGDQTYGARTLFNASVTRSWRHWSVSLAGDNVFNTYPERANSFHNFGGILPYVNISPFGFNGYYWHATVAYRW